MRPRYFIKQVGQEDWEPVSHQIRVMCSRSLHGFWLIGQESWVDLTILLENSWRGREATPWPTLAHPLQFSFWRDSAHPFGVCIFHEISWGILTVFTYGTAGWVEGWSLGLSGLSCFWHTEQAAQISLLGACVHDGDPWARGLPLFPCPRKGSEVQATSGAQTFYTLLPEMSLQAT